MRQYIVTYYLANINGVRIGAIPIVMRFYGPSNMNTKGKAFIRMLVEYGRAIGAKGSSVDIISIEC